MCRGRHESSFQKRSYKRRREGCLGCLLSLFFPQSTCFIYFCGQIIRNRYVFSKIGRAREYKNRDTDDSNAWKIIPTFHDIPSVNIDQKPACITTSFRFPSVTRKFWRQNYMGVSKNRGGPPKSSILIGVSTIHHQFLGFSPYFWKHPYKHLQLFGRKARPRHRTRLISCRKTKHGLGRSWRRHVPSLWRTSGKAADPMEWEWWNEQNEDASMHDEQSGQNTVNTRNFVSLTGFKPLSTSSDICWPKTGWLQTATEHCWTSAWSWLVFQQRHHTATFFSGVKHGVFHGVKPGVSPPEAMLGEYGLISNSEGPRDTITAKTTCALMVRSWNRWWSMTQRFQYQKKPFCFFFVVVCKNRFFFCVFCFVSFFPPSFAYQLLMIHELVADSYII